MTHITLCKHSLCIYADVLFVGIKATQMIKEQLYSLMAKSHKVQSVCSDQGTKSQTDISIKRNKDTLPGT